MQTSAATAREVAKAMNRRFQVEVDAQLERMDVRPPVLADTFITLGGSGGVDEDALCAARMRRKIEAMIPKVHSVAQTVRPRFAAQTGPILCPRPQPATLAYLKARWPDLRFEERPDQFLGDHWVVPYWMQPDPEYWQQSLERSNGV